MARINLKNAVSFKIGEPVQTGFKIMPDGIDKNKYLYFSDEELWYAKPFIEVDFGTFQRVLYFNSTYQMENFISEYLPLELDYVYITE